MSLIHAVIPLLVGLAYWLAPVPEMSASLGAYLAVGGILWACLTFIWLLSLLLRNAGIMDSGYPLLVLCGSIAAWYLAAGITYRAAIVVALIAIWALRLANHVLRGNLRTKGTLIGGEEQPYATWRIRYGGRWWWWSYFQVFMLQGVAVWVWMLPIVFATSARDPLSFSDWLGLGVWLCGCIFQTVGDHQLNAFKRNPENRGRLMQSGLWSLTRHPNYFGEAVMWLGYFFFSLSHSYGWLTVVGPVYVYWFMGTGSAAAGNERHMLKTRPVAYAQYMANVPMLLPRFWRRARGESHGE